MVMKNDSQSQNALESVLQQEHEFQEEKKAIAEKSTARITEKQKQLQQHISQLQAEYVAQSRLVLEAVDQTVIDQNSLEKQVKEVLKKRSKQVTEGIISYLPA